MKAQACATGLHAANKAPFYSCLPRRTSQAMQAQHLLLRWIQVHTIVTLN